MRKSIKFIDLFAGCGGLFDGFMQSGYYKAVASVEWEESPVDVLRNRLKTRWNVQNPEDEVIRFDFKASKRGRITELVVAKEYRDKHIGKKLLDSMKDYLKSIGCEKIMIAVFGYNENAIKFYEKNGYHMRMMDMIED